MEARCACVQEVGFVGAEGDVGVGGVAAGGEGLYDGIPEGAGVMSSACCASRSSSSDASRGLRNTPNRGGGKNGKSKETPVN